MGRYHLEATIDTSMMSEPTVILDLNTIVVSNSKIGGKIQNIDLEKRKKKEKNNKNNHNQRCQITRVFVFRTLIMYNLLYNLILTT